MNGSGSYYDANETIIGSGNGSDDDNEYNSKLSYLVIMIALSPLIFVGVGCILLLIFNIIDEFKKKCKKIKYKYIIYIKNKENPPPINNNKLSNHFIKQCNKINMNIYKKSLDCSICLNDINIEDYKKKPNDLIFLNCHHVFHTNCIQSWIGTQVKVGREVNCPLCRDHIVMDIPKIVYRSNSVTSDNSVASDDSVASYWND